MDIGGGTTDFAVYENNQPKLISSVRFAGNSIYGDFPGFGIQMNGFYNKYHDSYQTKLMVRTLILCEMLLVML